MNAENNNAPSPQKPTLAQSRCRLGGEGLYLGKRRSRLGAKHVVSTSRGRLLGVGAYRSVRR
eukprot:1597295-Rhodomonas_salina.1